MTCDNYVSDGPDDEHDGCDADGGDDRVEISERVDLYLVQAEGALALVPVTLAYDDSNPLVVTARMGSGKGITLWRWGRDVLWDGLTEPAGSGDMQVRPRTVQHLSDEVREGDQFEIELSTPDGHGVFLGWSRQLQTFLARTFAEVPAGTEYAPGTAAGDAFEWDLRLIELEAW